jgi:hypothetical protein
MKAEGRAFEQDPDFMMNCYKLKLCARRCGGSARQRAAASAAKSFGPDCLLLGDAMLHRHAPVSSLP